MIGTLRQIAAALGGDVSGSFVLAPGPGHSSKDRSLKVRLSPHLPDGFDCKSFADDDWKDCRDHVRGCLGLPAFGDGSPRASRSKIATPPVNEENETWRRENALRIWREAQDPRGTIVESYLASRGLELPPLCAGHVIRFHPACPWNEEPTCIQRTRLTVEGRKVDRWTLGPARGASIKIDADPDVTNGLTVGEGFETCLAARQIGFRPTWALGSAGAIKHFQVLAGIEALSLLVENDERSVNQRACEACAERWAAAGREVILIDPLAGNDVNDALREIGGCNGQR
jgi:putative DNA primase/helicase